MSVILCFDNRVLFPRAITKGGGTLWGLFGPVNWAKNRNVDRAYKLLILWSQYIHGVYSERFHSDFSAVTLQFRLKLNF